jgi:membrane-associated phospholipid phosphatase
MQYHSKTHANTHSNIWISAVLAGLSMTATIPSWADSTKNWSTASDVLALGLPAAAAGITLLRGDEQGFKQLALSGASSVAASELLKSMVHSRRPDGSDNKGFPSEHTAVAFTAVSYLDVRYGQELAAWRVPLYGLASLTGVARVQANKHHWADVLAGGVLGYASANYWAEPVGGGKLTALPAPGGLVMAWARQF